MKPIHIILFIASLLLSSCFAPRVSSSEVKIQVSIVVDGETIAAELPSGSTVTEALQAAQVTVGSLDRIEPPAYALAQDGSQITISRVREEFSTQQQTLAFERQTVRNESMPQGETRLIQEGVNGIQEITTRRVYENDLETSTSIVKAIILQPAVPEIIMVGVQTPFSSLPIDGKLVYIVSGNAWLMQGSTANRAPIVTSADLDGRILKLSPKGDWLLYTRKSTKPISEEINTLWALNLEDPAANPINLTISNVIHFADWIPGTTTNITYSTVEPRAAAPGWQANNDLFTLKFGVTGSIGKPGKVIEANTGGVYGWWGSNFTWSPDGKRLAYARPDGIGLVSFRDNELVSLLEIAPLQTHSDWAFIPPITWGADSRTLYFVSHAPPPGLVNPEESPYFDLGALSLLSGANVSMVRQTGMFAYPAASNPGEQNGEQAYRIAYLQALSPLQSETSGYRLVIMDRDGSNRKTYFPGEGAPGLGPQTPLWAPQIEKGIPATFVAVVYQGNLWLIDSLSGQANQITGDGLIQKIDWR
jgi:hypothetical protein